MKIAFFWTWEFSKNILAWILQNIEIEIKLIVSQPDKPVWRKHILEPTQVKLLALEKNIKILQPETLRNNEVFFNELNSLKLDFIIVVAYWKIIPKEILTYPKYWCINIHGSILPMYRWASPIQEAIKKWDKETWLTIMYMSEWMDEWDILTIEKVIIDKLDKTDDIFKKFEKIGSWLLVNTLKWIIDWNIDQKKQDNNKATYCKKILKEEWEINFKIDKWINIFNKYRAYSNWPWIYTYYNNKKFNIEDCELVDYKWNENIGKVLKIEKNLVWIVCIDNKILILKQIKLEWKKSMNILSFINWNKTFLEYNF